MNDRQFKSEKYDLYYRYQQHFIIILPQVESTRASLPGIAATGLDFAQFQTFVLRVHRFYSTGTSVQEVREMFGKFDKVRFAYD